MRQFALLIICYFSLCSPDPRKMVKENFNLCKLSLSAQIKISLGESMNVVAKNNQGLVPKGLSSAQILNYMGKLRNYKEWKSSLCRFTTAYRLGFSIRLQIYVQSYRSHAMFAGCVTSVLTHFSVDMRVTTFSWFLRHKWLHAKLKRGNVNTCHS